MVAKDWNYTASTPENRLGNHARGKATDERKRPLWSSDGRETRNKVLVMSGADISEIVSRNANMPFLPKLFDGQTLKAKVRAILPAPAHPPMHLPALGIRP